MARDEVDEAARFIADRIGMAPGTALADEVDGSVALPYADIPGFPVLTTPGADAVGMSLVLEAIAAAFASSDSPASPIRPRAEGKAPRRFARAARSCAPGASTGRMNCARPPRDAPGLPRC